jgi:hypothetical protein
MARKTTSKNGSHVTESKTETVAQEAQTEENKAPELTIQDLQNLRAIIDVASQRGAFKANEMMNVGNTYNRLDGFLTALAEANAEKETVEE